MTRQVTWRKSTYSTEGNNACVEVMLTEQVADVRDSKNTDGPTMSFSRSAWRAFLSR